MNIDPVSAPKIDPLFEVLAERPESDARSGYEAQKQSQLFMQKVPQFTIKSWIDTLPFQRDSDRQHFVEGYLKAGFAP